MHHAHPDVALVVLGVLLLYDGVDDWTVEEWVAVVAAFKSIWHAILKRIVSRGLYCAASPTMYSLARDHPTDAVVSIARDKATIRASTLTAKRALLIRIPLLLVLRHSSELVG